MSIMSDENKRIKCSEYVYLAYFVLMIGARALGMYEGTTIYTIVLVIAMLLFALKMIVTPHQVKEYVIAASLMLAAGIIYLHTGEKGLIVCFATLLGMKGVNHVRVLKYGAITAGVCIMGKMILGVFGVTSEKYYPQIRSGAGLMFRHSLGYAHPNTLHMNVLMLSMLVMYLITVSLAEYDRRSDGTDASRKCMAVLLISSAGVFGFNLYAFQYSGSRTGLLATCAFLIVNIWFYLRPVPGVFEKTVCYAAYPAACFITIVMPRILPDDIAEVLNRTIFNSRIMLANYFWEHNRISLWGIRLNKPDPQFQTYGLDMAYLYLFLQLGIIAFVIISFMTLIYVHVALKRTRMIELAVLMGTLFSGIWEPYLYNLGFKNFTYVFMGYMLYEITAAESFVKCLAGEPVSNDEPETDSVTAQEAGWISRLDIKKAAVVIAAGIGVGCICASAYAVCTHSPEALYADRESDEAGNSFGMDAMYLSADNIRDLKASGDLVMGYRDELTPMYRYDKDIAVMEYRKKTLSIGVWTGMLTVIAAGVYLSVPIRKNKGTS